MKYIYTLHCVVSEECRCQGAEIADWTVMCHTTGLNTDCNQVVEIFCSISSAKKTTTKQDIHTHMAVKTANTCKSVTASY